MGDRGKRGPRKRGDDAPTPSPSSLTGRHLSPPGSERRAGEFASLRRLVPGLRHPLVFSVTQVEENSESLQSSGLQGGCQSRNLGEEESVEKREIPRGTGPRTSPCPGGNGQWRSSAIVPRSGPHRLPHPGRALSSRKQPALPLHLTWDPGRCGYPSPTRVWSTPALGDFLQGEGQDPISAVTEIKPDTTRGALCGQWIESHQGVLLKVATFACCEGCDSQVSGSKTHFHWHNEWSKLPVQSWHLARIKADV
ncbi:uncharacterized protein LOC126088049 [Elephas maximus indicus]|uniref:uncharacterized protein LOC126088049 n=1 Tax=Elephas maximus indicus TaxID=99487 RepID=UPI002116C09B|nr:uncharacterized protein LOC126088049 [Elephas maximus indicus]